MDLLIEKPKGKQLFEIIVGTYEEFVVSYILCLLESGKLKLFQNFTNHAHSGSVKSIGCSRNGMLVSGGSDEVCHLINLRKRKELGNLIEQEGAITCIDFFGNKHMFTGSEDKTICVWETRNWECIKKLKGHQAAINSIAVHDSGKLMLTAGRDKTIRTWNLMQARCSFVTNLKESAQLVRWSPSGEDFLVVYNKHIDIYTVTNCGVWHTIETEQGINCASFLTDTLVVVGGENENISFFDLTKKCELYSFKAHERRVKDLSIIKREALPSFIDSEFCICSISSDGYIKLWATNPIKQTHKLLCDVNTKCRPNCLTVSELENVEEK